METKHEEMTATEHVERAQSQGQTVADYCRQTGLSVHALYSAGRQLKDKGLVAGAPMGRPVPKKPERLIAVNVRNECDGGRADGSVPRAPSGQLRDRVRELAGSEPYGAIKIPPSQLLGLGARNGSHYFQIGLEGRLIMDW